MTISSTTAASYLPVTSDASSASQVAAPSPAVASTPAPIASKIALDVSGSSLANLAKVDPNLQRKLNDSVAAAQDAASPSDASKLADDSKSAAVGQVQPQNHHGRLHFKKADAGLGFKNDNLGLTELGASDLAPAGQAAPKNDHLNLTLLPATSAAADTTQLANKNDHLGLTPVDPTVSTPVAPKNDHLDLVQLGPTDSTSAGQAAPKNDHLNLTLLPNTSSAIDASKLASKNDHLGLTQLPTPTDSSAAAKSASYGSNAKAFAFYAKALQYKAVPSFLDNLAA